MVKAVIVLVTLWLSLMSATGIVPLYALVGCFVLALPFIKYGNSYRKQFYTSWIAYLCISSVSHLIVWHFYKGDKLLCALIAFIVYVFAWVILESSIVLAVRNRMVKLNTIEEAYSLTTRADSLLTVIGLTQFVGVVSYIIILKLLGQTTLQLILYALWHVSMHIFLISNMFRVCRCRMKVIRDISEEI